jgi:hypothetical protein
MPEAGPGIQQDSSALWSQMQGKIDHGFKGVLEKLDLAQHNEDISPYLAETIRDVFFQLSEEDPNRVHTLLFVLSLRRAQGLRLY